MIKSFNSKCPESPKEFFQKNPKYYESFKNELATEGVNLPSLKDFNINVFTAADFVLVKELVGTTNFKEALNVQYVQNLVVSFEYFSFK